MDGILLCFWIMLGVVFYTFLGYGIILYLAVLIKRFFLPKPKMAVPFFEPNITLVVPCFNEADILEAKIVNCKQLDYPVNKLTLLFITDGSTDKSATIIKNWPEIILLHQNTRAGKTAAENRAMQFVNTPYVIFSDANTAINSAAIRNMIRHFFDERVGCVSGEKRIVVGSSESASGAGEGIYWKYESYLKKLDAELNSAVGAAGELVAFKTSLYKSLPEDTILDDFMQSMQIAAQGYKIAYEPQAYAVETASVNVVEEFKRKVRICAGGWQSIIRLSAKISPRQTPLLFFQYFSHRVLRWTITPFLLVAVFLINILLISDANDLPFVCLVMQILFYTGAVAGLILENKKLRFKPFFIPYYFCMMNYAVMAGLCKFLAGKQSAIWDKATRRTEILH